MPNFSEDDLFDWMYVESGIRNPKHQILKFIERKLGQREGDGGGSFNVRLFSPVIFYEENYAFFRTTQDRPIRIVGRGSIKTEDNSSVSVQWNNGGGWKQLNTDTEIVLNEDNGIEVRFRLQNLSGLDALPVRLVLKLDQI